MVENIRESAAKQALEDIRQLAKGALKEGDSPILNPVIDNARLLELLESNFSKLDTNNDGISRGELLHALSNPGSFTLEECEMLRLIAKYFDTIINLSDDESGEEMRLSRMDLQVLKQFLVHSNMSIQELHMWCSFGDSPDTASGPPLVSED